MEGLTLADWVADINNWSQAFGKELFRSAIILVLGLIVANIIFRVTKRMALKVEGRHALISNLGKTLYFLILAWALLTALNMLGLPLRLLMRFLVLGLLLGAALYMTLRPFFPTMPFKIGNTILAAGLFGKVEAVTFFHTRLKTFDGKTVFVPNSKIMGDIIINYHTTPNRRISLDITIRHHDDMERAMEIMADIMKSDERVKEKPVPKVYVLGLTGDGVRLGGRCWVPNKKYWRTRCDLFKLLKERIDAEPNISLAPSRHEVLMIPREQDSEALPREPA